MTTDPLFSSVFSLVVLKKMHRIYSLSKTLSKQKIGFQGNLDHLGKSLLSHALNGDNLPGKQNWTGNAFKAFVV